jgi:hypothetical protein
MDRPVPLGLGATLACSRLSSTSRRRPGRWAEGRLQPCESGKLSYVSLRKDIVESAAGVPLTTPWVEIARTLSGTRASDASTLRLMLPDMVSAFSVRGSRLVGCEGWKAALPSSAGS